MSVELNIWLALKSRYQTFPGTKVTTYFPGDVQGETSSKHALITNLMAPPEKRFIADGAPQYRRGSFRILYCVPLSSLNYEATVAYAAQMAAHFGDGVKLKARGTCVKVLEYPEVGEGYREDGWWKTPIVVRWETEA